MSVYSSKEAVLEYSGVQPADLGVSEEELNTLIESWLNQVKSLIDTDRNRDFNEEDEVPALVHNVAMRMAANMVGYAQLRRETRLIRVGEWDVRIVPDVVMTDDIKKDLRKIPKKRRFRMAVAKHV